MSPVTIFQERLHDFCSGWRVPAGARRKPDGPCYISQLAPLSLAGADYKKSPCLISSSYPKPLPARSNKAANEGDKTVKGNKSSVGEGTAGGCVRGQTERQPRD